MSHYNRNSYVANLPVGGPPVRLEDVVSTADIDKLPNGIVTGSNPIQFSGDMKSEIKSSVALSLLAAQWVATTDTAVATPQQWVDRHNIVLGNLGWQIAGGGHFLYKFDNDNVAVNEAVLPFLTAAF